MGVFELFVFNPRLKRLALRVLGSPIAQSKAYNYFYSKQIESVMKKGLKNPNHVIIENTNFCNANCITCCRGKLAREKGFMDMALFKKIIDDCVACGINFVSLNSFGEPFLDKALLEKIRYAKQKGLKVWLNTNGSLLEKFGSTEHELAYKLVDSGLDEIYISLDAATEETYKKIRKGLNFFDVVWGVKSILVAKRLRKSNKPKVVLDFVEIEQNRHEVKAFLDTWGKPKKKIDWLFFLPRNKRLAGFEVSNEHSLFVDEICVSQPHNWAGKNEKIVGKFHSNSPRQPCIMLWKDLVIDWDGSVPLCCEDINAEIVLGNVKKRSIKEIWNANPLQKIREKHKANKFEEISLCRMCKYASVWWFR